MAVGFPARYEERLPAPGPEDAVRDWILAAFKRLGWPARRVTADSITATVGLSLWSWGELVTVRFQGGTLLIASRCNFWQVVDWDKNRANVTRLIEHLRHAHWLALRAEARMPLASSEGIKAAGATGVSPPLAQVAHRATSDDAAAMPNGGLTR